MLYKQYGIEKFPGQFSQKFTKNLPLPSFLKQFNSNFKEMCFSIFQGSRFKNKKIYIYIHIYIYNLLPK